MHTALSGLMKHAPLSLVRRRARPPPFRSLALPRLLAPTANSALASRLSRLLSAGEPGTMKQRSGCCERRRDAANALQWLLGRSDWPVCCCCSFSIKKPKPGRYVPHTSSHVLVPTTLLTAPVKRTSSSHGGAGAAVEASHASHALLPVSGEECNAAHASERICPSASSFSSGGGIISADWGG